MQRFRGVGSTNAYEEGSRNSKRKELLFCIVCMIKGPIKMKKVFVGSINLQKETTATTGGMEKGTVKCSVSKKTCVSIVNNWLYNRQWRNKQCRQYLYRSQVSNDSREHKVISITNNNSKHKKICKNKIKAKNYFNI